ncbi:conjugal transfer protein TraG N-terminal domain-containing protein [Shewanella baltica]|uniref:conjugal transfer protein TraG N-terminal domain-containing protein n=1 Tax=Shewanella baltica TaxID=62322 RepID=UPI0002112E39|nr:conjugal transfer protein TraG N-terminal domain-containing protein [Shewanella baltica]AEH16240.1 TraG domain-containing protein [Shewanella baltica OS117]
MLTLYSLGDIDLMIKMAQGAELAFSSGGIANSKLIAIGFGITLLVSVFKQAFDPQKFHVKEFFIALFTYLFLMTPKVDFYIESVRTGEVSQSFTLPFGIVAPAALATSIGGGISKGMAEAYSSISPNFDTKPGANIDPLKALLKARFVGTSEADTSYLMVGENVSAYLKNCYFEDIKNSKTTEGQSKREIYPDSINEGKFDWNELKVTSGSWYTPYHNVNNRTYGKLLCTDVHKLIGDEIKDGSVWGKEMERRAAVEFDMASSPDVQKTLESLTRDNSSLMDLYRANFVNALISKVGATMSDLEPWERIAFQQEFDGIQQRRMTQAAQSSFFLESAPALITWFECFIFLVAPLMPLFLTLGSKGLAMAGKLFSFLLAVNFWPIIQVGVNLYTEHYFSKLMCSLPGNDTTQISNCLINPEMRDWSLDSLGGMNSAYTTLETFVSQAAIIQTMVPSLAMMIVFGGVHTMMAASQKSQMGANVDPKISSPQTVNSDGNTVSTAGFAMHRTAGGEWMESRVGAGNSNVGTGGSTYNATSAGASAIGASNSEVANITRSNTEASQATAAASNRLGEAITDGNVISNAKKAGISYDQALGWKAAQSVGTENGVSSNDTLNQMRQTIAGMTESQAQSFEMSAGLSVGPSGGLQGLLKTLGVNAEAGVSWRDVQTQLKSLSNTEGSSNTSMLSEQDARKFAKVAEESDTEANKKVYDESKVDTNSNAFQQNAAKEDAVAKQNSSNEQLAESKARATEIREGITANENAGRNSSIKMGELITSANSGLFTSPETYKQIAKQTADDAMRGKFGEAWDSATKGADTLKFDETNQALNNAMAAPNASAEDKAKFGAMKEFFGENQALYNKANDANAMKAISDQAQTMMRGDGTPVQIQDIGTIADRGTSALAKVMAATQDEPMKASAVTKLAEGAAVGYAAQYGSSTPNQTGLNVSQGLTEIGQAQIVDYAPPKLTSGEQQFKNDNTNAFNAANARVEQGTNAIRNGYDDAVNNRPTKSGDYDNIQLAPPNKWSEEDKARLSQLDNNGLALMERIQNMSAENRSNTLGDTVNTIADELKNKNYGSLSNQVIDRVASTMKNAENSPAELGRMLSDYSDVNSPAYKNAGPDANQYAPVIAAMAGMASNLLGQSLSGNSLTDNERPSIEQAKQVFSGISDIQKGIDISENSWQGERNKAAQAISIAAAGGSNDEQRSAAIVGQYLSDKFSTNMLPEAKFNELYSNSNPESPDRNSALDMKILSGAAMGLVDKAMAQESNSPAVQDRLDSAKQWLEQVNEKLDSTMSAGSHGAHATAVKYAQEYSSATENIASLSSLTPASKSEVLDGFNGFGATPDLSAARGRNESANGEGSNARLEQVANKLTDGEKANLLDNLASSGVPTSIVDNISRGIEIAKSPPMAEAGNSAPATNGLAPAPMAEAGSPAPATNGLAPAPMAEAGNSAPATNGPAAAPSGSASTPMAEAGNSAPATNGPAVAPSGSASAPMAESGNSAPAASVPAAAPMAEAGNSALAASVPAAAPMAEAGNSALAANGPAVALMAEAGNSALAASVPAAAPMAESGNSAPATNGLAPAPMVEAGSHGGVPLTSPDPEIRYVEIGSSSTTANDVGSASSQSESVVQNNPYSFDAMTPGHNFSAIGGFGSNVANTNVSFGGVLVDGGVNDGGAGSPPDGKNNTGGSSNPPVRS